MTSPNIFELDSAGFDEGTKRLIALVQETAANNKKFRAINDRITTENKGSMVNAYRDTSEKIAHQCDQNSQQLQEMADKLTQGKLRIEDQEQSSAASITAVNTGSFFNRLSG